MVIGVPAEVKEHEYRVSLTPACVRALTDSGHKIFLERSAGIGSGFSDSDYEEAGAELADKTGVFTEADLIVKVKEPLPEEYRYFRTGQAIFTFLHLAANPGLVRFLREERIAAFAYETLEVGDTLPLLTPMSEIAGKMSPVVAAYFLQRPHGGRGVLFTGVSGVDPARVVVLGAGVVGKGAVQVAHGMGADVVVISRGEEELRRIDKSYGGKVRTLRADRTAIESEVLEADVVIGAVLITGARAPKLISRETVSRMRDGSVIVDVSVDQGGCVETTRPTTHDDPVYTVDGVVHYAVANMPGAYPRTSTFALSDRTLPYVRLLAERGIESSIRESGPLRSALNVHEGEITNAALADSLSP